METPPPPLPAPDLAAAMLALDNQFCFSVYSAAHALNRVYKPLLDRLGLTYPQYLAMLVLWERDDRSVGEIGEKLMLETNTLTPLLKRLEALGAIARVRNPKDERQVRVHLTERGRAMRDEALAVPPAIFAATGAELESLTQLKESLAGIRDHLLVEAQATRDG
jgi:MarR family transcriptional regulator, organic hydroperoxide resistance regulator